MERAHGESKPFFVYFAGTVPHTPFAMPTSLLVNVTLTPAGPVAFNREWQAARGRLLAKLRSLGLVCRDYRQCRRLNYPGAEGASSAAYREPVAMGEPWLRRDWLYAESNFEQARLARLFGAGLAWFDSSVGTLLQSLDTLGIADDTITIYTADHGASYLGKGHVYEAGVRVPLVVRWPRIVARGRRVLDPVSLLDIFPTLLQAAGAHEAAATGHGESQLHQLTSASRVGRASAERPIFIEIGYARAVIRRPWKLVVLNDMETHCRPRAAGRCRNLHGEWIDEFQCNFSANGHLGNRVAGMCNMTYDAVARHAGFCDTRQLYNMEEDPLEQRNLVHQKAALYQELFALIRAHVERVEASNPAVARTLTQPPESHACAINA